MIGAIIFDADHTLYFPKHTDAYEKKFNYLGKETGIDPGEIRDEWKRIVNGLLEKGVRDYKKRSREYSTKKTLVECGVEEKRAEKLTEKAIDIFWKEEIKELDYDPEIKNTIQSLGKKYKLCVASDEYDKGLKMKLKKVFGDWRKYFEFIVSADDTKELKPSKKFCKIPMERFGTEPEETVFVGDSWGRELEVAKNMGLKTVLVGKEKEGNPDYFIMDISEIEYIYNI